MSLSGVRGLVLSGGFSTRMGMDKGTLTWEGRTLIERQVDLLSGLTDEVWISCRAEQVGTYQDFAPCLTDAWPSHGPMTGLRTAFHALPETAWLVLSVDLPGMTRDGLGVLLSQRAPNLLATVLADPATGILQPLAALWEPAALPVIDRAWSEGRFSLRRILEDHPHHQVPANDPSILLNLNRPEDLPATH